MQRASYVAPDPSSLPFNSECWIGSNHRCMLQTALSMKFFLSRPSIAWKGKSEAGWVSSIMGWRAIRTNTMADQDDNGETLAQKLNLFLCNTTYVWSWYANYANDEKMTDAEKLWHVQKQWQYPWNMLKLEKMLAKQLRQPRFDLPKKWR